MMRFIVMSPVVKALATNRMLAAWIIVALWGVSMAFAFIPGVVMTSLMAFFHPMLRILWHKAYRNYRAGSVRKVKLSRTACGCA